MRTQYVSELRYNDYITVTLKHRYKIGDVLRYYNDEPLEIIDITFYKESFDIIYVYNFPDYSDFDFVRDLDEWDVSMKYPPTVVS